MTSKGGWVSAHDVLRAHTDEIARAPHPVERDELEGLLRTPPEPGAAVHTSERTQGQRLSPEQRVELHRLLAAGAHPGRLALRFGITNVTVAYHSERRCRCPR